VQDQVDGALLVVGGDDNGELRNHAANIAHRNNTGMWGRNQKNKHQAWIILERALFVLGLLLLAHPFLKQRYFFTVDGPSHVYDAWLIQELFHPSAAVHASWEINPLPVPDWSGHAILALLLTILKPPE